jgi:protein phosphatase
VAEPRWLNGTLNIDTGCVFGGSLTALRYPERELVAVPARQVYAGTARRFLGAPSLGPSGVDPRWLIYLPPAPALPAASRRPGLLEHPEEVFAHFRAEGIERAVCEETLGGTRAVVVICRDEAEARRRFGGAGEGIGAAWTRSARRLFAGPALEKAFLGRLRDALGHAGFWARQGTGWVCLEGELTPGSLGAGEVFRERCAALGAAARAALPKAVARLAEVGARGLEVRELLARYRERYELSVRFVEAYRRRCLRVRSVADLRFAPFHLLATESAVHAGEDHVWHLETLAEVCRAGPELLAAVPYLRVDLGDPASEAEAVRWWEERIESGGAGMVVKPLAFTPAGRQGLATPAMLCRGREALRLVYGPEYTLPENLERLRSRIPPSPPAGPRELALGIEGLDRFVHGEPLWRVHECVFGVLALESERARD